MNPLVFVWGLGVPVLANPFKAGITSYLCSPLHRPMYLVVHQVHGGFRGNCGLPEAMGTLGTLPLPGDH